MALLKKLGPITYRREMAALHTPLLWSVTVFHGRCAEFQRSIFSCFGYERIHFDGKSIRTLILAG